MLPSSVASGIVPSSVASGIPVPSTDCSVPSPSGMLPSSVASGIVPSSVASGIPVSSSDELSPALSVSSPIVSSAREGSSVELCFTSSPRTSGSTFWVISSSSSEPSSVPSSVFPPSSVPSSSGAGVSSVWGSSSLSMLSWISSRVVFICSIS